LPRHHPTSGVTGMMAISRLPRPSNSRSSL